MSSEDVKGDPIVGQSSSGGSLSICPPGPGSPCLRIRPPSRKAAPRSKAPAGLALQQEDQKEITARLPPDLRQVAEPLA